MVDTDEPGISALWERLRRRKVVQWTLAYAAASWGLLQAVAFLGEAFGWSDLVKPLSTLIVASALPIAVVLAWYHGDKGEQRVRTTELLLVTGVLLVGVGVVAAYLRAQGPRDSAGRSAVTASTPASPGPAPARVASALRLAVLRC